MQGEMFVVPKGVEHKPCVVITSDENGCSIEITVEITLEKNHL